MKKNTLSIFIILIITMAFKPEGSVIGQQFPALECEDYNGKKVNFPSEDKAKFTLLGIAFSNDAETDLKSWIAPVYNKFAPKSDSKNADAFAVNADDINFFFIPKYTLLNQLASKQSKEKIKSGTDKEMFPYLLFYAGNKAIKKELDFEKKDIPYIFVFDNTGKIVYATSGIYDSKKLEKIIDIIE